MPGGDPLAAALAAGETPSPELVAAAGGSGVLSIGHAAIYLAVVLVGLAVLIPWRAAVSPSVAVEESAEVFAGKARE
jgi:serine/threonine-protein kinase